MNIMAVVPVDLQHDFFGAPGTLGEDLAGRPVLTRTLERLGRVDGLDGIALLVRPDEAERARQLAGAVDVLMVAHEPSGAARESMRIARAFGRYGWRGGVAGTTIFDELFDPAGLAGVIVRTGADSLLLVPAGAALLDVGWAEGMLAFHRANAAAYPVAFCQAPPGLAGGVFRSPTLMHLAKNQLYPGKLFAYTPEQPVRDPIGDAYNYTLPEWLVATPRRFLADGPRGLWLCEQILAAGGEGVDGETACRIAGELGPEPWPREVTIELTARRPIEDDLRPRADRADLSVDAVAAALAGLEACGDVNVMFAGAGDALLHPDWPAAVAAAKAIGTVGLASYGVTLDAAAAEGAFASGLDLLEVYADAVSDEVYAAGKRGGSAGEVWANIESFVRRRRAAGQIAPLVVPTMLKTRASLHEQDAFVERSLRLTGWGLVIEPSDAAGQWDDHGVVHMAPPARTPCRRLTTRLTVLADGRVTVCEEDLHGDGVLDAGGVLDAWRGEGLPELRRLHAEGRWADHRLCAACREFHRP